MSSLCRTYAIVEGVGIDEYRRDLAVDEPRVALGGHDRAVARFDELDRPKKSVSEATGE